MAGKAKKTEHAGAKHGCGAYWGHKIDAKQDSRKKRRQNAKCAIQIEGWLMSQVSSYLNNALIGNILNFKSEWVQP
jgi:hypothetical protein